MSLREAILKACEVIDPHHTEDGWPDPIAFHLSQFNDSLVEMAKASLKYLKENDEGDDDDWTEAMSMLRAALEKEKQQWA